ncbi:MULTISPECIES: alpha/beta hydrolase [unclassified Saccharopolyspora]|uniref:alpha/beta hydrolase n=1 Tax=unclassified Saccharopolyspora TaxID=2646250 RepID=UPI001CD6BFBA|nr:MULTISPECIES: alpha/beta hydrolase [unclassified Saccharopolyspora]MCA1186217.1 alpha/beta hydrolase [Saccharopolyspora sp. 6T]MCA1278419.1 alpha/beta hydrolase [Saccharopolyspora sp. 7B]
MQLAYSARGAGFLAAVLVAGPLVPAAVASPDSESAPMRTNGAAVPVLDWAPCDLAPNYECATAEVPLSYRNPAGQHVRLAVGRLPAVDQEHKLGTIFYNPGGPGDSGKYAPALTPELHQRFDIVGVDPRGIGESAGLSCFTEPGDGFDSKDSFPVTPEQERTQIEDTARGVEECARNAGPLLNHMSTANVARDLDLLRAAVGEDRLDYYGISYGSHLGTVYANLFPERVGAVAIDGVVDPIEWTTGYRPDEVAEPMTFRMGAHGGAQQALRTFLDACAVDERCAFQEPGADLLGKYNALLDRLLVRPVTITRPDGTPMEITYQTAVVRTSSSLKGASASTSLGEFLQQLHELSQPGAAGPAPVVSVPPAPQGWEGGYMGVEQRLSVMCNDSSNPSDPWSWSEYARRADEVGRGFGSYWTYLSLGCANWPGGSDPDRYTGPWNQETASPVLVIGNRQGDPATPYDDARKTSQLLSDARLLTLDSFGHGARGESTCIDGALNAYFADGALPAEDTICQPDRGPFDPVP